MNFEKILNNITDYTHFLTVDEIDQALIKLGQEYPEKVTVFEAGKSRKGSPILCAKIGKGSRNALMFGCPHPNEPIGAMMAHYFVRAIAEDDTFSAFFASTFISSSHSSLSCFKRLAASGAGDLTSSCSMLRIRSPHVKSI
jgi:hypothetical protein